MTVDVAADRAAFLAALYDGCEGLLEFRAFNGRRGEPPVGRAFCAPTDASVRTRFAADHRAHDIYFGVATRADDSAGTLENCRHLAAVFADIDFKMAPEADARAGLARFPLPPSAVVQSGGGLHVYWFLREPLDLRDPDARAEAYQLLRRLADALHADMAAAEPARGLRVPGTVNRKPEYGAPRPVVVEILQPDRRYNPSELDAVLPPEPDPAPGGTGAFVLPERIPEGERNHTLWRYGRSLRAKGLKLPRILAELERVNRERCKPPLPDDELGDIAHNVFTEKDRPTFPARGHGATTPATPGAVEMEINAGEGDLKRVSGHAWDALLAKNNPPVVYSFGGAPSWIEHDDHGTPLVKILTPDRMRYRLARVANWYAFKKRGADMVRVAARPPKDVCADVLATPDPPLPRLTRIVEVPVFTANGRLLATEGYDAESGVLYAPAPGFTFASVPPDPRGGTLDSALHIVNGLLHDFPFTSSAEKATAVALFLLPFVRELVEGSTPLHLIEKPAPGTGATLLVESLMLPATGQAVPAMGAPRDDGEMGKRLTALLRRGASVIFLDNIPAAIPAR